MEKKLKATGVAVSRIAIILLMVLFLLEALFFATRIGRAISPDETFHLELIQRYRTSAEVPVPTDQRAYHLGPVGQQPYLYHLFMGKALYLNVFGLPDLIYLRLLNVALTLLELYLVYRIVRLVTKNRLVILSTFALLTNTLMFTFISAMVSYDNLVNLLAVLSVYLMLKLLEKGGRIYFWGWTLTLLAGSLTKVAFLPLVLLEGMVVAFHYRKIFPDLWQSRVKRAEHALIALVLAFGLLNLTLYGRNLIRYRAIDPPLDRVIGLDRAIGHNWLFRKFHNLRVTRNERERIPIQRFVGEYVNTTLDRTYGILGHKTLTKSIAEIIGFKVIAVFYVLMVLLSFRKICQDKKLSALLFISVGYLAVVFLNNYLGYLGHYSFGEALQGRYNFPVLALLLIIANYSLFSVLGRKWGIAVFMVIISFFIFEDFIWFYLNASPDWFR